MKVKLNLDPTDRITFDRIVLIPTPEGKPLKLPVTYKHRTREQVAELFDGYVDKARKAAEAASIEDKPSRQMADGVDDAVHRDIEAVKDVATDWGVEGYAFNDQNLGKFFRLYPGAASAIVTDYRISVTEGRLGN